MGVLAKTFSAQVVDEVIAECGRTEQRHRSLPARSVAYFAMGMALHSDGSYEDVLALISDGLAWADRGEGAGRLANKAAHERDGRSRRWKCSTKRHRFGSRPLKQRFVSDPSKLHRKKFIEATGRGILRFTVPGFGGYLRERVDE